MTAKQPTWRAILMRFIGVLRIVSRDETGRAGEVGTKINLWRSQQRILDEIAAGMQEGIRRFLILKSRQLGSTTICEIITLLWLALHPGIKAAIVVDVDTTREKIREELRKIMESVPARYFGASFAIVKDNKFFMSFSNGSQIDFRVAGVSENKVNWGESSGYSLCWLTEVASYGSEEGLNNFEEAMSDVNPTRLYLYESTAKGYNHWRTRWKAGRKDKFTTRCVFVGWWGKDGNALARSDPRFAIYSASGPTPREIERMRAVEQLYGHTITPEQLAWIRMRQADEKQSESNLNQNQPWTEDDAFIMTGKSYFQSRRVAEEYEAIDANPQRKYFGGYRFWLGNEFWAAKVEHIQDALRYEEIELRMWQPPRPNAQYVVGADPAGGSDEKNDRHAFSVWRCYADKLAQVAEYADNMCDTRQAAWVLAYLCGIYGDVVLNLELSGGYGNAVMAEWKNIELMLRADIYAGKRGPKGQDLTDFLAGVRWYLFRRSDNPASVGSILNWKTNQSNKNTIAEEFRDSHTNGLLVINSKPLLEEMLLIQQDGDSVGAPNKQKDDRWMSACLANHAWIEQVRPTQIILGETYETVMAREAGEKPKQNIVDEIVRRTLQNLDNGVGEEPPAVTWMRERGLV